MLNCYLISVIICCVFAAIDHCREPYQGKEAITALFICLCPVINTLMAFISVVISLFLAYSGVSSYLNKEDNKT